ncbi:hypothetical protein C8A05DRAFT_20481 [Staphylotrichum tortipilum]|uniref:Uncharacterized protein n=1 Tax=Staphylotrichum tortipilum TaxID=2831512 RepID=A0AAN6RMR1_9PEZI|nr:hypothetical protein C8A05DRAFT_20481 [Staphylotrichum longicolle]
MSIGSIVGALTGFLAWSSAASFSNPLKVTNGSDPHIAHSIGYCYLMMTTWTILQITRAETLGGHKTGKTRVAWTDGTPSRCYNVWAPELHQIDNRWYIYYTPRCSWPASAS